MKTEDPPISPQIQATTPLMQQYLGLKEKYKDEILFFRLGDFYEMFYEDALKASPILEVVLTQRQSVPMCGLPYHAATTYISKLLKAGLSIAIAEQLEDPKKTKGMVKRGVVRVITPGTLVEEELLSSSANNFLVAIVAERAGRNGEGRWALAAADISTGRRWVGEAKADHHWMSLKAQLAALDPSEVLLAGECASWMDDVVTGRSVVRPVPLPSGIPDLGQAALAAMTRFLETRNPSIISTLGEPSPLPSESSGVLFLDEAAIRHLELVDPVETFNPSPTLLSVLDKTVTPMGGRLLRWWMLHPSTRKDVISGRHAQVEVLFNESGVREELRLLLRQMSDLERIMVRSQAGVVSPRELGALRRSLRLLPDARALVNSLSDNHPFSTLDLSSPTDLMDLLSTQLSSEPPSKIEDGGVISDGVHKELDDLRSLRRGGRAWIAQMEAAERARTGIGSLKVGYNDIFGYFLEVSKSNLSKVPPEWIRKQTMANGERYITPELKEQEEKLLSAEAKILELEKKLFGELVHQVAAFGPTVARLAEAVAHVDSIASLSEAASQNGFVRPALSDSGELTIQGGRHPIIERQMGRDRFIPNHVSLGKGTDLLIITGPNMAGKSTYLRQTALIVIMAQMGSFIPAESAVIGLVDKIFTRIGASDRLSKGQSTFMVEMQEVASLLLHSTPRSLLILDEVGRGTSTYDGVSIAWAVVEYLSKEKRSRTLFATHYFELTQLADKWPGVSNAHATAKEWSAPDGKKQVVFLYQIRPGAADRSYGIHVAEMAGVPEACIKRARVILTQLESGNHKLSAVSPNESQPALDLFNEHPVIQELKALDVNSLTPLEALNTLADIKRKAGGN